MPDGELLAFHDKGKEVLTQYEGGSTQHKQAKILATDYETVIAQLILQRNNLNCKIIEDFDTQMECEGKFDTFESQILEAKQDKSNSELAQGIKEKQSTKSEQAQVGGKLDDANNKEDQKTAEVKTKLAASEQNVAALKVIQKAVEKMEK